MVAFGDDSRRVRYLLENMRAQAHLPRTVVKPGMSVRWWVDTGESLEPGGTASHDSAVKQQNVPYASTRCPLTPHMLHALHRGLCTHTPYYDLIWEYNVCILLVPRELETSRFFGPLRKEQKTADSCNSFVCLHCFLASFGFLAQHTNSMFLFHAGRSENQRLI